MNSHPLSVSSPKMGNGKHARACWNADTTASALLESRGKHSVHPVAISVRVNVQRKRPS